MQLSRWPHRTFAFIALFTWALTSFSFAQDGPPAAISAPKPKHFDHVLIVVLENQNYESTIQNDVFRSLVAKGVNFTNFGNLFHHSYPNYLAMISGSDFNLHKRINSDAQVDLPADNEHGTIANLLNWKNYAENYPAKPDAQKPFLGDSQGRYARKHVPFLSFKDVQAKSFHNVIAVDPNDKNNAFVSDIRAFVADPQKHPLPEYMFYSPNLDNDGHDPYWNPQKGLKKSADWLSNFLTNSLNFDPATGLPKDDALKRTLVVITYDESEGNKKPETIYTVFLGDMVKPQEVSAPYNHYSVLRTIEDNFGIEQSLHKEGDGAAQVINGVWK